MVNSMLDPKSVLLANRIIEQIQYKTESLQDMQKALDDYLAL
nr:hypothetical protein [Ornithinibacillus contaminans]